MNKLQGGIIAVASIAIVGGLLIPKGPASWSRDETKFVPIQAASSTGAQSRTAPPPMPDDPSTTNNESNDQPIGYFGSATLCAHNHNSGNSYPLDVDLDGTYVTTMYFPRGGHIDFDDCELDEDLYGDCYDYEGRGWTFEGEC